MTCRASEKDRAIKFLARRMNLTVALMLGNSSSSMSFIEIADGLGSHPPLASITFSLSRGKNFGIFFSYPEERRGKTIEVYVLTEFGRRILNKQINE